MINHSTLIWQALIFSFCISQIDVPNADDTSLYFDIVHKNNVVGSLKATKTIDGPMVYYQSLTSIETRIIKEIEVDYMYDVTFENEILEMATVNISLNDRTHAKTRTERKEAHYQIVKNGETETALKDTIGYATILLYFEEPVNISRCYSEQAGKFNTIVSLGDHSYKKINSTGKENRYYYKEGVLEKAVIDGGLVQFEIIARD